MKRLLFILLFLICSGRPFSQETVEQMFYKGNILYGEEKYKDALKAYLKIYNQGIESLPLLYNIGNCYFKLGDIGHTVLFYERARRINPLDPELRFNMDYIHSLLKDEIDWSPGFFLLRKVYGIYFRFPLRVWAIAGTISWVCLIILFYTGIFRRGFLSSGVGRYPVIILIGVLLFVLCGIISWNKELRSNKAVVIPDKIVVRYGPGEGEVEALELHTGGIVKVVDTEGSWCRIQLPDGKSGWTEKKNVEVI